MPKYPEFAGRVVAVTGAAQGIGASTARAFAGERAHVVLLDIDEKGAQQVAAEIRAADGRALAIKVDVTDERSVAHAIGAAPRYLGSRDACRFTLPSRA